jgi:oligopeptide/dipeptide ABC transporter ATP-binding protein
MSEHEGGMDEPRQEPQAGAPQEPAAEGAASGGGEPPTEVAPAAPGPFGPEEPPATRQPGGAEPVARDTTSGDGTGGGGGNGDGSGSLLGVEHLQVLFPIKAGVVIDRQIGQVHAVDDVSFGLRSGETLGVVGESGCGKTTLIRALVRLIEPTAGTVSFEGKPITKLGRKQMEPIRRQMQMVFQDPQASLNPRKRVGQILATPLQLRGVARGDVQDEARALLDRVGLAQDVLNRFPHEFSGGQRQRIGIARALAVNPKLVLLDEPVSALDVSIQAQVINLLDELQDELHLSYVFVAHDLSVVRHVSDRIVVMYLGKLMEISPGEELYTKPIHPYTSALLGAIPIPDPSENRTRQRTVISGEPPNPINPPSGCRFHTRCPRASEICRTSEPPLTEYARGHLAACHHPQNVTQDEIDASTRSEQSPRSAGSETPDLSPGSGLQTTPVSAPASAA